MYSCYFQSFEHLVLNLLICYAVSFPLGRIGTFQLVHLTNEEIGYPKGFFRVSPENLIRV